ncbi:MAG: 4'-phosphopantetheinyl transferase superfamily protein [Acidobacteriota bacterium]
MSRTKEEWQTHSGDWQLPDNRVHVWSVALDQPASYRMKLREILSADEQSRADRFYFERDRDHFIIGRGVLRTLLGYYLGIKPECLSFHYGPKGKPSLTQDYANGLKFNISHSHGMALYGFTKNREIGVDIEQIRAIEDAEQIAKRFFSPQEAAIFSSIPADEKYEAFFNCWTRKEAYIKATGDGLSHPLDRFNVTLRLDEPAKLLTIEGDAKKAAQWSLSALTPAPGYIGALIVTGNDWQLDCYKYSMI